MSKKVLIRVPYDALHGGEVCTYYDDYTWSDETHDGKFADGKEHCGEWKIDENNHVWWKLYGDWQRDHMNKQVLEALVDRILLQDE